MADQQGQSSLLETRVVGDDAYHMRDYGSAGGPILLAWVVAAFAKMAAAQSYSVFDLGDVSYFDDGPRAINNFGQIVGTNVHMFRYSDGQLVDLGNVQGYGINDAGAVVRGQTLWENGAETDLGNLGQAGGGGARAINNVRQIVGDSQTGDGGRFAFLWQNGSMSSLDALCCFRFSIATDINITGKTVGWSTTQTPDGNYDHAFLYADGHMNDLGTLPNSPGAGGESLAHGINDANQIVGASRTYGNRLHAFLYEAGVMRDLVAPGVSTFGGNWSEADGINNAGIVVGAAWTPSGSQHAFLFADGAMLDLNDVIPLGAGGFPWELKTARAINEAGQIVGTGMIYGQAHGFLLVPLECDDSNACTSDAWAPRSGCSHEPVACDDGDDCTNDSCDSTSGCSHVSVAGCPPTATTTTLPGCVSAPELCDDGDPCTNDTCEAGTCRNEPVSGFEAVTCSLTRSGWDSACDGHLPSAVQSRVGKARASVERARGVANLKRARKLVKKAARDLTKALRIVSEEQKRRELSPGCGDSLAALIGDAKLRAETWLAAQ